MSVRPQFVMLLAASLAALILLSGQATINLKHKPELPIKKQSTIKCSVVQQSCDIQLTTSIEMPEHYYHIGEKLRTIGPGYTIYLHLSGFGGAVKGIDYLESSLKATGAKVVSIVEGNVYSAHAYLSVAFDEMRSMGDYSMLFHTGSHYKEAFNLCLRSHFRSMIEPKTDFKTGELQILETYDEYVEKAMLAIAARAETDRGLPSFEKCVVVYTELANNVHSRFLKALRPYLTTDELNRFAKGEDVIVRSPVIMARKIKHDAEPQEDK